MSIIKSALELAMERADNIKVDKTELKRKECEKSGKEAASQFLNRPKYDFKKWLSEIKDEDKKVILEGVIWVFNKNITLPNTTADVDKLLKIKEGYLLILDREEEVNTIFKQLTEVFQQYIENSKALLEQCKSEFAPKLQQKAMQIAQQTGQLQPIEPETDRDFIEFHREQQEKVSEHFKAFIKQLTDTLESLL